MEVGDYVRTKDDLIAKYIGYNNEYKWHLFDGKIQWFYEYYKDNIDDDDWEEFKKEDVIKTSSNIIDLIENGDIVVIINGLGEEELIFVKDIDKQRNVIKSHKLKSIVTKKQFERMKYEVK